jgi:hypothetical protein
MCTIILQRSARGANNTDELLHEYTVSVRVSHFDLAFSGSDPCPFAAAGVGYMHVVAHLVAAAGAAACSAAAAAPGGARSHRGAIEPRGCCHWGEPQQHTLTLRQLLQHDWTVGLLHSS